MTRLLVVFGVLWALLCGCGGSLSEGEGVEEQLASESLGIESPYSLQVLREDKPTDALLPRAYVRGQSAAPFLNFRLIANQAGMTLPGIQFRLYLSSAAPWISPVGDMPADLLVSSAKLQLGSVLMSSAEPRLVDMWNDGYTPGVDYYQVEFHPLAPMPIAKGITQGELRVNLMNTRLDGSYYMAADLVPEQDVMVRDPRGASVKASGPSLNEGWTHIPVVKVHRSGTLAIAAPATQPGGTVAPGSRNNPVAYYDVTPGMEVFAIDQLSVVSVATGMPFDPAFKLATPEIFSVSLEYVSFAGGNWFKTVRMDSSGLTTLGKLITELYAIGGGRITVFVDISASATRGRTFRLGLVEGNTRSTFHATGTLSGTELVDQKVSGSGNIRQFTIQ